jgi:RNA polymerase sigma-70 factor (ECF subfamily)
MNEGGMDTEDRGLVEAFGRGEDSAFSALVIKYREGVYRVARRMLGNHEDAADVTQEVFIRVHRALPRFDGRSKLSTWVYRIAVNLCLDVRARLNRFPLLDDDDQRPTAASAPDVADDVVARETQRLVANAVALLPPRQRAMLALRLYQDLPYQDIARIMGCSEGTVKATMFAAIRRVRRTLVEEGVATP